MSIKFCGIFIQPGLSVDRELVLLLQINNTGDFMEPCLLSVAERQRQVAQTLGSEAQAISLSCREANY